MSWFPQPWRADSPSRPTRVHVASLGLLLVLSFLTALCLVRWAGFDYGVLLSLPLTILGLSLIVLDTHWALCFAAFAITPLGNVQREVLGVTINLPELLILSLIAKELLRMVAHRERVSSQIPWKGLALLAACMVFGVVTGLLRRNGVISVLQDFRQFTEYIALFCLVLQRATTRQKIIQLGTAYVLGATVIAIHGIIQHFVPVGISETQISSDLVLHHGVRSGSFYGATPLGGLMVLAVGPAIGLLMVADKRRVKALLLTCIGLCLLAIIFTKTRGSWVGMMVALGFFFAWARPTRKQAIVATVLAGTLALAAGPTIVSRLATLADPKDDSSLMERTQYYATAVHIGQAHPILGLGWGCFYKIDDIIREGRYVKSARAEGDEEATVHSAYLQIFVKSGAVGLVGFLIFLTVWLERIWRVHRTRPHPRDDLALFGGISAGLVGYLFHSTFEDFFQWPVMAQSFWLLLALSFAIGNPLGGRRTYALVPISFTVAATLIFLAFTGVCLRLETAHTDHFEKNVDVAIAAGNVEKALAIAKRATEVRLDDPLTHVVYAKAHFAAGDTASAMNQLDESVSVMVKPGQLGHLDTGILFYFPPTRFVWAQFYRERENNAAAVAQYELARAYTDLGAEKFVPYHATLYETYANAGYWARALDFGAPDDGELDSLPAASLARLACVYESRGMWKELEAVATRLLEAGDYAAHAQFLLGQVALFQEDTAAAEAHFRQVIQRGHTQANYPLGLSLSTQNKHAEALEAFIRTPENNAEYPIALAHALANAAGNDNEDALKEKLIRAIGTMTPLNAPEGPKAFQRDSSAISHDGPVALSLLWGTAPTTTEQLTGATLLPAPPGQTIFRLEGTSALLQLQWAENRFTDPALLPSSGAPGPLPGWIDGARDWFQMGTPYVGSSPADGDRIELHLTGIAWFYSVPVPLQPDRGLLLTGTLNAPENGTTLEWQLIDEDSVVVQEEVLLEGAGDNVPFRGAAYFPPEQAAHALRTHLYVARDGQAKYSNLALLSIAPPPTP